MLTYLRFTPAEFQAIARVCRPLELTEQSFRTFKPFLVASLRGSEPALAERLGRMRSYQIGIIYQYVKERQGAAGAARSRPLRQLLSREDLREVAEACRALPLRDRFQSYARMRLVLHFREASPPLAAKLTGLSDSQFERLCRHVHARNNRRA